MAIVALLLRGEPLELVRETNVSIARLSEGGRRDRLMIEGAEARRLAANFGKFIAKPRSGAR
jgi:hypothetical protein